MGFLFLDHASFSELAKASHPVFKRSLGPEQTQTIPGMIKGWRKFLA